MTAAGSCDRVSIGQARSFASAPVKRSSRSSNTPSAPRPRSSYRRRPAATRTRSTVPVHVHVHWVRRYILFHGKRHPQELGAAEVTAFLSSLATHGGVSSSTQNQALAAILFLHRFVLGVDLPWLADLMRAKRPTRLPIVLTRQEVAQLLESLTGTSALVGALLYGTGLRLLECLRLRAKDVDFAGNPLRVREGKGNRDRGPGVRFRGGRRLTRRCNGRARGATLLVPAAERLFVSRTWTS